MSDCERGGARAANGHARALQLHAAASQIGRAAPSVGVVGVDLAAPVHENVRALHELCIEGAAIGLAEGELLPRHGDVASAPSARIDERPSGELGFAVLETVFPMQAERAERRVVHGRGLRMADRVPQDVNPFDPGLTAISRHKSPDGLRNSQRSSSSCRRCRRSRSRSTGSSSSRGSRRPACKRGSAS